MDQWKPSEGFFQGAGPADISGGSSQRVEHEAKESVTARKVQKADREKLRRDRLNEQFAELGNALDPDRPKNDKATILGDTIQMLKELTAQVNRLKTEYTSLSEESRELTQEKNELREEKATLKSENDSLNAQYQQRLRCMYPWATLDPSVVMGPPPSYPFPVPVPIPSGPIPIHTSLQPYPYFRNQSPGAIANPCPPYVPYSSPLNPQVDQPSSQRIPPHPQRPQAHPITNRCQSTSRQDSRSRSSDQQQRSGGERSDDFSDVVTELELKTPGSAVASSHSRAPQDQDLSSEERKGKHWLPQRKGSGSTGNTDGSSSSRCSSTSGLPDNSSNSFGDGSVANN